MGFIPNTVPTPKKVWISLGYNSWVAEALEGREVTPESVSDMTTEEILDHVFQWHGFIGFTHYIINAVDNVRRTRGINTSR